MSNVRPSSHRMETSAQTASTVRALAQNTMPQALHRSFALLAAGRGSNTWAGCPSFGGQRTSAAARKRYPRSVAIGISSLEQSLRTTSSVRQGGNDKGAEKAALRRKSNTRPLSVAFVPQGGSGLSVVPAIPAVSTFGAVSHYVVSPARPNPAVERTAFGRRSPLR